MPTTRHKQIDLSLQSHASRKRRKYPTPTVVLVAVSVPVLLGIIAISIFVVMPRVHSHAAGAANPNVNCTLVVPANPLSAKGLATPYQLTATDAALGPCNENNPNQSAFVQAVIYNPANGDLRSYSPLVIDQGTQPALPTVVPQFPDKAIVGLWFGFNGTNLLLQGAKANTLRQSGCVNGLGQSLFTQFAYCNAPNFFAAVNKGIANGQVRIPRLGIAKDGLPCPTSRDFSLIDQDQSDNVQTAYLANADGQIAQFSTTNQNTLPGATLLANPSDNKLLTSFVDPTLGCQAWQIPDLTNKNAPISTLATDEIQAQARQRNPIALVPLTDPMTVVTDAAGNATQSLVKTDLYRRGVDQTLASSNDQASGTTYCRNFLNVGISRLKLDEPMTMNGQTPNAAMATNLFTFLAMRANQSWTNLTCQNLLNIANPVTLTMDPNGVVTGATINTMPGAATPTPTTAAPGATPTPTTTTATPMPGVTPTPTTGSGTGGTPQLTTGTAHITMDIVDGLALIAWNLTYANHASQQINVSVVQNSCSGSAVFNLPAATDTNSQSQSFGVITGLQGQQILPTNWFLAIIDPTAGGIVGCSPITTNGTTGTAMLSHQ
jgi:hypothetical protein